MAGEAGAAEGDVVMKAKILIGAKWHACTVERTDDIPHWSGQMIRRYSCRMKNGDLIFCGRNSIKLPTPPAPPRA